MNEIIGSALRAGSVVALLGGLLVPTSAGRAQTGNDTAIASTHTAPSEPSSRTAQGAEATNEITGPVRVIEPSTRTVYLKNSTKALRVDGDTQVTKDGGQVSIESVSEGDQVRASYSGAGDDVSVGTIEVLPPTTQRDDRSRSSDTTAAKSEVTPRLSGPSASPTGGSGRQSMPTQRLSR